MNEEKQMALAALSDRVSQALNDAIAADLPAEEREAILKIVQQAVLDASNRTHKELKEAAVICCGPRPTWRTRFRNRWTRSATC